MAQATLLRSMGEALRITLEDLESYCKLLHRAKVMGIIQRFMAGVSTVGL